MTNNAAKIASKAVSAFKERINETSKSTISDSEWQQLTQIVQEALSEQQAHTIEQLEQLVRQLRSQTDRPEIGL